MIPRNEVQGIDLDNDWDNIREQIVNTAFTRMPAFHENLDNVVGFVHLRKILPQIIEDELSLDELQQELREPYFIPEGTSLNRQLLNFQRERRRIGLVVDEYGDIQGLVTLEDLLEEIVGEFTTDPQAYDRDIHPQTDGSFLIDGSANVREINRACGWELPEQGPKTLNGLILETLENIPEAETSFRLDDYTIEVKLVSDQAVKTARVLRHREPDDDGD